VKLFEGWHMKRIRWVAIFSTTISALGLFFVLNSGLALQARGPNGESPLCVPVFDLPFTNHSFPLPLWMWPFQLDVFAVSTLAAITCWIVVLLKWRAKLRKAAAQ
jgi:hypothetical protein